MAITYFVISSLRILSITVMLELASIEAFLLFVPCAPLFSQIFVSNFTVLVLREDFPYGNFKVILVLKMHQKSTNDFSAKHFSFHLGCF